MAHTLKVFTIDKAVFDGEVHHRRAQQTMTIGVQQMPELTESQRDDVRHAATLIAQSLGQEIAYCEETVSTRF